MNYAPLYPRDGEPYYVAMAEALDEYEAWLAQNSLHNGIQVYSRKELDTED
jgi:hypothetical protein